MPEIRITVSEKLDKLIDELSDKIGIKKTEYCKTLILNEIRKERDIDE